EALARDRPVDEVEIDVLDPEPLRARIERLQCRVVALVVVPQLRGDEDVLARDAAVADRGADIGLVAVDARGVDVAIAEPQRGGDRGATVLRRGLPDAEADL